MKKILILNGEIRNAYSFNELKEEIKEKVLIAQVNFEAQICDENSPYYADAVEMDNMKTSWFLPEKILTDHKEELIETIEANEYLYDEYGEILPINYKVDFNNNIVHTLFNKYECTIWNTSK